MAASARLRRIVTALDERGITYVARADEIPPGRSERLPPAVEARSYPCGVPDVRVVWDCEQLPAILPADPDVPPSGRFPRPGGARVSVTIFPPGWEGEMFWSSRVDILWVMAGELTYRTDGGDEIVIREGEFVVQNGANKALSNRGDKPLQMGAVMFGAVQRGRTPPLERYHGPPEALRFLDRMA
jgi:quercetin dioxygenase-like cupin family protein